MLLEQESCCNKLESTKKFQIQAKASKIVCCALEVVAGLILALLFRESESCDMYSFGSIVPSILNFFFFLSQLACGCMFAANPSPHVFLCIEIAKTLKSGQSCGICSFYCAKLPKFIFLPWAASCESMLTFPTPAPSLPMFLCIEIVKTLKRLFLGLDYC